MRARLWSALALLSLLLAYSAPTAMAAAPPVVTVQTQSSGYLPGSTVTVVGSVTEGGVGVSGAQVALEADGSQSGQTYWVDQVTTAGDGSFTDQFVLPGAQGQDTSLKIIAVSEGVRASTSFGVLSPPPAPPSGGSGGSSGSTTTCQDQAAGVVLQKSVDSAGGTFTSTDSCIVLTVPAGAFSSATNLTVTESMPALPPGSEVAATPVFAIDFAGAVPATSIGAEIYYSLKTAAGEPTARVGLFAQDGMYWRYLKDTVDGTQGTVTASIDAAGSYVVAVNDTTFTDLPQGYWAQGALDTLLGRDAISGYPDGGFHPGASVTRAQFVKMLVLALGFSLPQTTTTDGFTDVNANAWYAPYVDAAVTAKLIIGVNPRAFRPDAPITRAQLALMVARAMNGYTPAAPLTVHFTDQAKIPSWALAAVMQAAEAGIVQGLSDGSFDPRGDATRAQSASMVANLVTITGQ